MRVLSKVEIQRFRQKIYEFYDLHKRDLPWRNTLDPYAILVSEVMLQQTQVERVVPRFIAFMAVFPTAKKLADASLGEVLTLWSGLGYNRRARMLWLAAGRIEREFDGVVPKRTEELQTLEGIGPYTASAIAAFAYNQPVIVLETNIRSVFISEFLGKDDRVTDGQLIPIIEVTLDRNNPRKWYNALMDYGANLKLKGSNPGRKSRHYTKQSAFVGSGREVRGQILKVLAQGKKLTHENMEMVLPFTLERIETAIGDLLNEGLVIQKRNRYYLP